MNLNQGDKYCYEPVGEDHIRLVRRTASMCPFLCLEIVTTQLRQCPKFIALSYSWDDQLPMHACRIGDKHLLITANVAAFFSQIPTLKLTGGNDPLCQNDYFWIDALCINQEDVEERSRQVAIMQQIYRAAHCLILWLGEATSRTRDVFSLINSDTEYGSIDSMSSWQRQVPEYNSVGGAYQTLMQRPYWRRAWVLQEATTPEPAGGAYVCCGPFHARRDSFIVRKPGRRSSTAFQNGPRKALDHMDLLRKMLSTRQKRLSDMSALQMLPYIRSLQASDDRDKLFAILPMASDGFCISIRYDVSEVYIFRSFAAETIIHSRNLDIISYAGQDSVEGHSWVPDWTKDAPTPILLSSPRRKDRRNNPLVFKRVS